MDKMATVLKFDFHTSTKLIVLWLIFMQASCEPDFPQLNSLKPSVSYGTQEDAVRGLIQRKVGDRHSDFTIVVDPSLMQTKTDTFKIESKGGHVTLTGSSGVAAAMAFYHYTRVYCGCHSSWAGDQFSLPPSLPSIPSPGITITTNDRFRYYQNVCTVSYSYVWWDWTRWEREIDWMALHGINMALAFNAQEAIWQQVYRELGLTDAENDEFFCGPAFLAWGRMGNLQGWGGPLPPSWHDQQVHLQHRILQRMRDFGMLPVVPAFAGHVPRNMTRLFPDANYTVSSGWGKFSPTNFSHVLMISFTDPLFVKIGNAFLNKYIKEFGTDHVYSADSFNEMTPTSNKTSYLRAAGQSVYKAMAAVDPLAIWLMQGWLFRDSYWTHSRAKALLTSVPLGNMLVLDLYSDVEPLYKSLHSYYGQPFIWCMLHNFGGTTPMYGNLVSYNEGPFKGRNIANSTMVGIGLTPEGINQNDVVYEFMMENAWRKEPRNISQWLTEYGSQRYGAYNEHVAETWRLLERTVYNCTDGQEFHGHAHNLITYHIPSLSSKTDIWYNVKELAAAASHMMAASPQLGDSALFRYDMVDVVRQSMQVVCVAYYANMTKAYQNNDTEAFIGNSSRFLDELKLIDILLGTDDHFLLGAWLESAKALGTSDEEKDLYEYNARNQVTLWGPTGNIRDYANKQWNGLMRDYYHGRWELFVQEVTLSMQKNVTFNQKKFGEKVFSQVEEPFTFSHKNYPSQAQGDTVDVARQILKRIHPVLLEYAHVQETNPKDWVSKLTSIAT